MQRYAFTFMTGRKSVINLAGPLVAGKREGNQKEYLSVRIEVAAQCSSARSDPSRLDAVLKED